MVSRYTRDVEPSAKRNRSPTWACDKCTGRPASNRAEAATHLATDALFVRRGSRVWPHDRFSTAFPLSDE
jgi:hypothetical protein